MLAHAGELNEEERQVWDTYKGWFIEVEKTGMNKSYKMVVLLYMLSSGPRHWTNPVTPEEVAPFFHRYLTEKEYRRRADLSDQSGRRLIEYDEKRIAHLICEDADDEVEWEREGREGPVRGQSVLNSIAACIRRTLRSSASLDRPNYKLPAE